MTKVAQNRRMLLILSLIVSMALIGRAPHARGREQSAPRNKAGLA